MNKPEIQSLKQDLSLLRLNVINMPQHGHGRLLRSFMFCETRDGIFEREIEVIEEIIKLIPEHKIISVEESKAYKPFKQFIEERTPCPLCGSKPSNSKHGYQLDEGMTRHLSSSGKGRQCFVIEAARQLASDDLDNPYRIL